MTRPTATILIVDDEIQNRKLLEVLLRHEGYLTLSAVNGEEALALIAQRAPDLILLDIMMPGMDGYQVASNLKANPATSNIPIIMLTAQIDRSARLTGLNAGVEEFLTKPVGGAELQLRVRNLLRLKAYGDFLQNHSRILEQQVQARTAALTAEIAERKHAEKRFHTLFEFAPDAVVMIDQLGIIALVNRQAETVFGYQRDELLGQRLEILMPEAFRLAHADLRQGFLKNAMPRAMGLDRSDLLGLRKDGTVFPVDISLSPMESENGIMVAAAVRDMTELKRKEEALRGYATRLRELSHRLRTVEETERRAISRELHDRIGQELSTLGLILGSLGAKLPRESLRAVHKPLQDMQGLLKSMVANVRDVMAELRPPVLDDYGLLAALRQLVTEFAKRSGIAAEMSGVELLPRLPSIVETAMYRISQEALNNIVKHAQAKKVEISLYTAPDRVVLDITDDGIGFDANETPPDQQHWGLITMRERAEAVGVVFHLESATGAGTRIVLEAERAAT